MSKNREGYQVCIGFDGDVIEANALTEWQAKEVLCRLRRVHVIIDAGQGSSMPTDRQTGIDRGIAKQIPSPVQGMAQCEGATQMTPAERTAKIDSATLEEIEARRDALTGGYGVRLLEICREQGARLAEWELFRAQFGGLSYHYQGMGCGIEDRGITDRYQACEHGWDCAMDRVAECIPEEQ